MNDEIIGKRFGKLVVERFNHFYIKPSDGKKEKRWYCVCDCGGSAITSKRKLDVGHTTSCGCILRSRGGITTDKLYQLTYSSWNMMIQRVTNPEFRNGNTKTDYYIGYVEITPRWLGSSGFNNFIEDVGLRPSDKYTIDRINPNNGYCKDNCRWTDDNSLQSFNQLRKKNNKSGKTGVRWDVTKQRWFATINRLNICKKQMCVSFEEASVIRDVWELELYGFNKKDNIRKKLEVNYND